MEDLIGLGKGSEKLIEVIANAIGAIYKPYGIRREAVAEAYKIKVIGSEKTSQKENETRSLAEAKRDEILILDGANTTIHERAAKRKIFNEIRRQRNLEDVLNGSFRAIKNEVSEKEVDPDWMQEFIRFAEEANSEQMQDLWSRVLAGETELPGSFSLQSLAALKKMSKKEALVFQRACQIASSFEGDDYVFVIESFGNSQRQPTSEGSIELNNYSFDVTKRMILSDISLLHDKIITSSSFKKDIKMDICDKKVKITPKSEKSTWDSYHFTSIGSELAKLIQTNVNEKYYDEVIEKAERNFLIEK